jgi:hypothetical protein
MDRLQTLLANTSLPTSLGSFILNLFIIAILAYTLSWVYINYATSISNRKAFAKNFIIIATTTLLIISVVKSSLALSLGLVGALSIVRFRTAIKEPEELAYMFLCITLGLGLGADQRLTTIVAFVFIVSMIIVRKRYFGKDDDSQQINFTVISEGKQRTSLEQIKGALMEHCSNINLRHFDESKDSLEACFLVEFLSFKELESAKLALRELNDSLKISFVDNTGIF